MDVVYNTILTAFYVGKISGKEPLEIIKKKTGLSEDIINSRMDELIKNGLLKDTRNGLTELGRSAIRVVFAGGVFDIIHPGHIHTLNAAKELGDVLVVVVATDKTTQKLKNKKPLHHQEQRRILVESLSMVDLCVIGNEEDMFTTVDMIRPDIIALGYDQVHQEKYITEGCKRINLEAKVARLQSPVPEISSSKIEKEYGDDIHNF
ncbi:MAG: adenylyltransferase/cytidyltransferase family protein [Nitrosopumilaceae archaeon]|nr:adenylyltransferase/cytidyltransferase family protein [Nitrosopumilaceae archaeon]